MMKLSNHLGGHLNKTHIDEGSLDYLIDRYSIKSFLDLGCGPGGMVRLAEQKGLEVLGIDGDYTLKHYDSEKFVLHDYTKGPLILERKFDLCWSCEFVEHVEEIYIENYMQTIQTANRVLMTFAPPGTPGHHHVNCQSADYWIDVFKNYNFNFLNDETDLIRSKSTMKKPFIKKRGLFFQRT